jgi:dethiobiotin synthetase
VTARTIVITGTDTGVGKTVVTAAIAAAATAAGHRVAVVKPAQTGVATGEEPDAAAVDRLAKPATVRTFVAYPDPLAPLAAARVAGEPPLPVMEAHIGVRRLGVDHDVVLVEGAGGLLVPLGAGGWTAADMAVALRCEIVVVTRAGLGTLNHTALTLEALDRRNVPAFVVIGSWPAHPDLVHLTNLDDLPGNLAGVLPQGVGSMRGEDFRAAAHAWLVEPLYGTLDIDGFREKPDVRTLWR